MNGLDSERTAVSLTMKQCCLAVSKFLGVSRELPQCGRNACRSGVENSSLDSGPPPRSGSCFGSRVSSLGAWTRSEVCIYWHGGTAVLRGACVRFLGRLVTGNCSRRRYSYVTAPSSAYTSYYTIALKNITSTNRRIHGSEDRIAWTVSFRQSVLISRRVCKSFLTSSRWSAGKPQSFITNGAESVEDRYPYFVSLRYKLNTYELDSFALSISLYLISIRDSSPSRLQSCALQSCTQKNALQRQSHVWSKGLPFCCIRCLCKMVCSHHRKKGRRSLSSEPTELTL